MDKLLTHQHSARNAALDLTPLPYESIISSIWRYAWRNGLRGSAIRQACSASPSYSTARANASYNWFENDIFTDASGWDVGTLEVDAVTDVKDSFRTIWWHSLFRYCPLCLEHGYHSFWHQSKLLSHCPLDGSQLTTRCNDCDSSLPVMAFSKELTHAFFACPECQHPISGVEISISFRTQYQDRREEIEAAFRKVQKFWKITKRLRGEICSVLPGSSLLFYSVEPRLRLEMIVRQATLKKIDIACLGDLPCNQHQIPKLEVLEWHLKEFRTLRGFSERVSRVSRISRGVSVYRATLRRLEWLVDSTVRYSQDDYQQLLRASREQKENLYRNFPVELVALCLFRSYFETIASVRVKSSSDAQLDPNTCFLIGEHVAHKMRLCWRAEFVVSFAWIYWIVKVVPAEKIFSSIENLPLVTLSTINTEYDPLMGDSYSGKIAFPTPDNFSLSLFPLIRRSAGSGQAT